MDKDAHKKTEPETEFKPQAERPAFKSSFKTWLRIVALIVVAVFLPEQVAQAVEYDWRVIWQRPAASSALYAPGYLKDITKVDIPLAIKNILLDISGKPVNAVKISPNLTVELEKPLKISKQRIEEIYNWLKGRPCGAKALYDFLSYNGLQVTEQDIAVLALTIDILNGTVKAEGNPKVIKNSLYALSQAAEFFGHKLYPVKMKGLSPQGTDPEVPFIAHLKTEHYILVNRITEEKVYYIDEHKEEFLPKEKFLQQFTGYALVGNYQQLPAATAQLLTETEAKAIKGAKRVDPL
jgi:hypothetical protein